MAVIETWFEQDLQKPVQVRHLDGSLFSNNANGNRIGVSVYNNGEPVTLTGAVSGYAILADGTTVPCTGTRSGNKASILVPPAAYLPGAIFISVFLTDGNTVTTLAAVSSTVQLARTDSQVSPGSVITDWTQTINAAMQAVTDASAAQDEKIDDLKSAVTYTTNNITWHNGGISGTTGMETTNGTRIKSGFIDRRITTIIPTSGYKIAVVAWAANGEFIGDWNGSSFVTTGLVFLTTPVVLSAINSTYNIRIVAGKTNDGSVTAENGENILLGINVNEMSKELHDSAIKMEEMVNAHINLIQHLTPRTGYYYDGIQQNASSAFNAYPLIMVKGGVTYYYRKIYASLSKYYDLTANTLTSIGNGTYGSFTPSHDSLLALTVTPSQQPNALLTTNETMYNAEEHKTIFYPTGLYVEKNNIPNNLVNAVEQNMFAGSFDWSDTWENLGNWTTDTEKHMGLVVKKRTNSWSGIYQAVTVEQGKRYHFSAWVKVSDSKSIQVGLVNSSLGSTATIAVESIAPSTAIENFIIPARSVAANKWRKINVELIALTSGTIHPLVQLTGTGATIYVAGYTFAEGRNTEKNVYTCLKDGTGDFSKICEAVDWATMYCDSTVYVGAGEWDIVDEFGSAYMDAVQESYNNGNYLKNRIHMIFSSDSMVVAHYTGTNNATMLNFSPFNSGIYGFTLENLNINCSRVRYCVHDERQTNTDQYTNKYINCKMYLDNTNNTGTNTFQCIGGGLGTNGHIIIEGGDYQAVNPTYKPSSGYVPISYHNSWGAGKSRIDISGVYIHDGSIRLNWFGPSTEITECYVHGCSFTHAIVSGKETQDTSPNENIRVIEWNNEIRQVS